MDIDQLTIGQAKHLSAMFSQKPESKPPKFDGPVVAQFIGRFVFVCYLEIKDGFCYLSNVRNVRYWEARDNGLGDLATEGKIHGDKIDIWPDQVIPLDKLGPVMKASLEHWA